jgi:hydroxymethylbilane synthase/uroporphyrinogen III methyltransferase/synthase
MITVKVAARDSMLSKCQVIEVLQELKHYYPRVKFEPCFIKTTGDLAQNISLMHKEKTDFFTKEVDELILSEECDIGIHSAKDLPEILPHGLCVYAMTKGLTPLDSVVFRLGDTLQTLPFQAKIGVSSLRRVEMIHMLRSDFQPVDIRGTIEQRLDLLNNKNIDAAVIAEAALIRLGLINVPRYIVPGYSTPLQGRLAITGRINNQPMYDLFKILCAG